MKHRYICDTLTKEQILKIQYTIYGDFWKKVRNLSHKNSKEMNRKKRNEKNQKRNETIWLEKRNETERKIIEYQETERNKTKSFRKRNETKKKRFPTPEKN
jgi:hypothetical protein